MRRALLLAAIVASASPALAGPTKILVLQTEGRADAKTRAKLDAAILKLASKSAAIQVVPGDITFADAAAAVGCQPEVPTCGDEVLGMLAVDEVVYATATPKPGGVELVVHRLERGASRDARMTLAAGAPTDELPDIAPLFGVTATAAVATTTTPTPTEPVATEPVADAGVPPAVTTEPAPPLVTSEPAPVGVTANLTDTPPARPRLQMAGMIGGGAMLLVGFLLWGEAGTIQEEVDTHPTSTRQQLEELAALERRGDSFAAWGNVLFLGGAVLGGISTYYYVKHRKAQRASVTSTARITPTVFGDHGAGLTLTFGGSR